MVTATADSAVVSCLAMVLAAAAAAARAALQPIVQDQALYFKNLAEMKTELESLTLPANASLFTYDAVAMYPSINTADCMARLTEYLLKDEVSGRYGFSQRDCDGHVPCPHHCQLICGNL